MTQTVLRGALLALVFVHPIVSRAAEALPVLSGRWSTGDCARSGPMSTRWFGPGTTASSNDRCRITAEDGSGGIWHVHLSCRYRAAHEDGDDVVIAVASPTSLRWIDQCTATTYRFCGRDEPPTAFTAVSR